MLGLEPVSSVIKVTQWQGALNILTTKMMVIGSSSICQWRLRAVDGCPTKTWLHFVQINMKSFGISYENANDKYDCRIKAKSG